MQETTANEARSLTKLPEWLAAAKMAMPAFLLRQRWLERKTTARLRLRIAGFAPFPYSAANAAIVIWKVTQPQCTTALHYFAPLARVPAAEAPHSACVIATLNAEEFVVEAFAVEGFLRAWISLLAAGSATGPLQVGKRDLSVPALANAKLRPVNNEQSNTSIRIGDEAVLKVIRKLEGGPHPELELSRYLTHAGFAATPSLLRWIDYPGAIAGRTATLSILQSFMPNEGDGWNWLQNKLRSIAQGEGTKPYDETLAWLKRVAARTAEMHAKLAVPTEEKSFSPEPVTAADIKRWTDGACDLLQRAGPGVLAIAPREPARDLSRVFVSRATQLKEEIAQGLGQSRLLKTRHHGDFHLGQLLVTPEHDAAILDFEGEPLLASDHAAPST